MPIRFFLCKIPESYIDTCCTTTKASDKPNNPMNDTASGYLKQNHGGIFPQSPKPHKPPQLGFTPNRTEAKKSHVMARSLKLSVSCSIHLIHAGHNISGPFHRPRHRRVCNHRLRVRLHSPQLGFTGLQLCDLAAQPDQLPGQDLGSRLQGLEEG